VGITATTPWLVSPFLSLLFYLRHQLVDGFLHRCVNMMWAAKGNGGPPLSVLCMMWSGAKGNGGPPLSVLCAFYKQRISVTLQHT
jgi:hypothetical protein